MFNSLNKLITLLAFQCNSLITNHVCLPTALNMFFHKIVNVSLMLMCLSDGIIKRTIIMGIQTSVVHTTLFGSVEGGAVPRYVLTFL